MDDLFLYMANFFFFVLHTVLISFNLFGWLLKRTRKLNLITLLITFGPWILLGCWKGWGYCFLTDWHYGILEQLGEKSLPSSYIAFLVERTTGWLPGAEMINRCVFILAALALVGSLWTNLMPNRPGKRSG